MRFGRVQNLTEFLYFTEFAIENLTNRLRILSWLKTIVRLGKLFNIQSKMYDFQYEITLKSVRNYIRKSHSIGYHNVRIWESGWKCEKVRG